MNCERVSGTFGMLSTMSTKKSIQKLDHDGEENEFSALLDLPELALECILGKLSPSGLCNMASVCSSLRERCKSDRLWERHLKEKWGDVIGQAAYREWKWFIASQKDLNVPNIASQKSKGWISSLACMWPFSWFYTKDNGLDPSENSFPVDSVMSFYLSLENGKFWFPAQVFNREHGHVGFMLSCYDAELNYDRQTDTFRARYPPHGRRTIVTEEGVEWERLRAPPVDTPAHDLHASDCLNELKPGDHIEIQWRRNKEFPYGWWYGIVGHLEVCYGNDLQCCCRANDTVILEFNQYSPRSRWRRTTISRKEHREEGSEAGGFYGGIRKLDNKEEILMWKKLWPTETLE